MVALKVLASFFLLSFMIGAWKHSGRQIVVCLERPAPAHAQLSMVGVMLMTAIVLSSAAAYALWLMWIR